MEPNFVKANNSNLPKIDSVTLGVFFASNKFCPSEFQYIKTSVSSRPSYGDNAITYVQLKREGKLCILKCKICPELKANSKTYPVTLIIDEQDEAIFSVECLDCDPSQGVCKHSLAFIMWVHRRSEEPSCDSIKCYWKKPKLSPVGTGLKYVTAKDISGGHPMLPSNPNVLIKFLEEGRKRNLKGELIRYQPNSFVQVTVSSIKQEKM